MLVYFVWLGLAAVFEARVLALVAMLMVIIAVLF